MAIVYVIVKVELYAVFAFIKFCGSFLWFISKWILVQEHSIQLKNYSLGKMQVVL